MSFLFVIRMELMIGIMAKHSLVDASTLNGSAIIYSLASVKGLHNQYVWSLIMSSNAHPKDSSLEVLFYTEATKQRMISE